MTSVTWKVYIILCSDNTLYTGISLDVDRRFSEHGNRDGAKYFRGRKPLKLVYIEDGHSRSSAAKREYLIKKMSRKQKVRLIGSEQNGLPCYSTNLNL